MDTPLQKLKEWALKHRNTFINYKDVIDKIEELLPEERDVIINAFDDGINRAIPGKHYFTQKYGSTQNE